MSAFLSVLVIVLAGCWALGKYIDDWEARINRLRNAENQIDDAYRQTRRRMNEAAGQEWRNLVE